MKNNIATAGSTYRTIKAKTLSSKNTCLLIKICATSETSKTKNVRAITSNNQITAAENIFLSIFKPPERLKLVFFPRKMLKIESNPIQAVACSSTIIIE